MGNAIISTPKDCMDAKKVNKFVEKKCRELPNNVSIRKDNGTSHEVVTVIKTDGTKMSETILTHDTGIGLACKIFKFFKTAGLIVFLGGLGITIYLQMFDPLLLKALVGG